MDRKPRRDSKLDQLPDHQWIELRDKLLRNNSLEEIEQWLLVSCGVDSSSSAISRFYRRHCAPLVAERRKVASLKAEAIGKAMEESPVDWDSAIMERVRQAVFELVDGDQVDPKAMAAISKVILKAQDQELARDKFDEAMRKARLADEVGKVLGDESLSANERDQRCKQIFGIG